MAKALARAGVASRREVERLIAEGRVALNGQVLDTPAVKVAAGDRLTVDGAPVGQPEPVRVWRYHKPVGLMTTHRDPQGRPTVFEALPEELPRVISVGRLDLNSEGLLLLTNDGGLARALELPATGLTRRYRARAHGHTTQARLDQLQDGITIEGVRYGAIEAHLDKAKEGSLGANLWITLTLTEGKNREVRKVLEALGLTVNRLIRLSYGPFLLGELPVGAVEEVGPRVIREQLAAHIAPEALPRGGRTPVAAAPTPAGPSRRGGGQALAAPSERGPAERGSQRPQGPRGSSQRFQERPSSARPGGARGHAPRGDGPRGEAQPARGETAARPQPGPRAKTAHGKPASGKSGLGKSVPGKVLQGKTFPGKPAPAKAAAEPKAKPTYKAGWAKPKPKPKHPAAKPGKPSR